tara:strand:- start:412 stop:606 length:195 start_codon:yes stop_codon:yes gene_type:complete
MKTLILSIIIFAAGISAINYIDLTNGNSPTKISADGLYRLAPLEPNTLPNSLDAENIRRYSRYV